MNNQQKLEFLENQILEVRYNLMIKGTQLDFAKQNISKENINDIDTLQTEVNKLRKDLKTVNDELVKLKFRYYVSYEVRFYNIWTDQIDKESYNEVLWLNQDLDIDLPSGNDWMLLNSENTSLLTDLIMYLKHKYDEVTLLRVKRLK